MSHPNSNWVCGGSHKSERNDSIKTRQRNGRKEAAKMSKSEYESYLETIPYDAFGDYSVFRDQVSMEEENQQIRQEKTQK